MKIFFWVAVLCCFFQLEAKDKIYLRRDEIPRVLQEIFKYHVEHKEFSPVIAKRSFKIFIQQFDPYKLYLVQEDIDPLLNLSNDQIKQIISEYQRGEFRAYDEMNQMIQKAIYRSRKIREQIKEEIFFENRIEEIKEPSFLDYAQSENELKRRMHYRLIKWLNLEPADYLNKEKLKKKLQLWENRRLREEQSYLFEKEKDKNLPSPAEEHEFCVRILKAIARSLDPHSAYFSPDEADDFRMSLMKQFSGIGLVLKEDIDGARVSDLILGSPAHRSGQIQAEDFLFEIDGKSLQDLSFDTILQLMKGPTDSEINLGFLRKDKQGQPVKIYVKLRREKIVMEEERLTFSHESFADGIIGKITLPAFYDNNEGISAEKDLRSALKDLKAFGKLRGLIIDLRENGGGFLTQAVKLAGLFVPKGVIVVSKYRDGEIRYMREIDGRLYFNGPLILLTSKASASAAEIVAGALKDHGVAIIVGDQRTYGKGSMQYQTITDDAATSFYKVTVGRYYTLSGKSTQIDGVEADIVVPTQYFPYNIGERFLEFPLSGDQLQSLEMAQLRQIDPHALSFLKGDFSFFNPSRKSLTVLKQNSEARLKKNQNFQTFLEKMDPQRYPPKKFDPYYAPFMKNDFGVEDLQMVEAVNILKDMILIEKNSQ